MFRQLESNFLAYLIWVGEIFCTHTVKSDFSKYKSIKFKTRDLMFFFKSFMFNHVKNSNRWKWAGGPVRSGQVRSNQVRTIDCIQNRHVFAPIFYIPVYLGVWVCEWASVALIWALGIFIYLYLDPKSIHIPLYSQVWPWGRKWPPVADGSAVPIGPQQESCRTCSG